MTCKDTLAQRAAKELNVEGYGWEVCGYNTKTIATVSRLLTEKDALLARIDELEAEVTRLNEGWRKANCDILETELRRSEPMPEPVPDGVVIAAFAEFKKDFPFLYPDWQAWWRGTAEAVRIGYTRLIWERGDAEPVDPLAEAFEEIGWSTESPRGYRPDRLRAALDSRGFEIVKRGMELAKEIG